jgi:hypothetical protein
MRIHGVLVAGVVLGLAGPARADGFSFSVGKGLAAVDLGAEDVDGAGASAATDLSTRIGYRRGDTTVFALIDYTRLGITETTYVYGDCFDSECDDEKDVDSSISLLMFGVGAKHLFDPSVGAASPYVVGALYTGVPSEERDGDSSDSIDDSWSLGALAGFGGEYAFAESFALGAEFGLNYFYVSLDGDPTLSYTQFYSAMTLSFYL